ncbi:probable aminopeptidase NPEPL1 isoform X2 [Aricia agestis]|nr:probable aminopeptidase NPEPL1 isoform X2 [Aricia agestis]XP_041978343.1 probable aminopeptidase NPEPL1 isoform X2 [Aricia agestis]
MSNTSVSIKFKSRLTESDPEQKPVLFIGQPAHLSALSWQDVKCKLEPRVTEEAWKRGLSVASAGDTVELWPKAATVGILPPKVSRHATPARSHVISKLVRSALRSAADEYIVLVCRKRDLLASAVAIARCVPLYSARSALGPLPTDGPSSPVTPTKRNLTVEIQLAQPDYSQEGDCEDVELMDPVLLETTLSSDELCTVQDVVNSVRLAAMITDMPANIMTIDAFIEEAHKVAKELDLAPPTVIRGEELKARGMGGIYGVGKAAEQPPALVVLSYRPPSATESVAWVGKGIIYDTGGLSMKSPSSMLGMKGDCGGAAGVLGAFRSTVLAGCRAQLHAVLCLAENSVGPRATRPDDIHQLYSGRTVEINNTDAEGRLVLADGVTYAHRDLKATTIVDMATLTGAQGTATGKHHAAILSNRDALEARCVRAGRASGDLAHALPFAPDLHFREFSSAMADMKNSVADRGNAQPSCAGLFVLSHLGFDYPGDWLHVDMASPAHIGERATGYGVALLNVLFGGYTNSRLLKALSPPQ